MKRFAVLPAVALVALAACSADTTDYRSQTEDFITDNAEVQEFIGVDVVEATCVEPSSTEVGTEYTCEAVDADGEVWDFEVTINADDQFLITDITPR
jgi:hypothetical protein